LENKLEEYLEQISVNNRNKEKSTKNIESLERQILKNKEAMENIMNLHSNEKMHKNNYLLNLKKEFEFIKQGINNKNNLINEKVSEIKEINLSVCIYIFLSFHFISYLFFFFIFLFNYFS